MAEEHHRATVHAMGIPGLLGLSLSSTRSFPRHCHDQYGIGLIASGGQRSWSGVGRVRAVAGDIITVNPGEMHDGSPVDGTRRLWHMLYIEPEIIRQSLDLSDASRELTRPVLYDPQLQHLMAQLFQQLTAATDDRMALEERCCHLLGLAFTRYGSRRLEAPPGIPGDIARIRQRLDDAPQQSVTLAELAAMAGLSRFQLLRAFTRAHGTTPHAYLLQRRVLLARRLIAAGHDLSQAALEAGFSDQSHMSRAFSRQLGLTPGRYRRAYTHA